MHLRIYRTYRYLGWQRKPRLGGWGLDMYPLFENNDVLDRTSGEVLIIVFQGQELSCLYSACMIDGVLMRHSCVRLQSFEILSRIGWRITASIAAVEW